MVDSSFAKELVSQSPFVFTPPLSNQTHARSDVLPDRMSSKSDLAQIEPMTDENFDNSFNATEGKGQ